MSTLQDYLRLKDEVEQAQKQADRSAGALEQSLKRLKDEFDCSSLKEAESMLKTLKKQEQKHRQDFEEALAEFEEEWLQKRPPEEALKWYGSWPDAEKVQDIIRM